MFVLKLNQIDKHNPNKINNREIAPNPNQNAYNQINNRAPHVPNQVNQIQNQQPVPITQNFQLAPNPSNNELESKYVNNIDEVKNTFVMKTGIFINKDFTSLWIKDVTGNIRTFRTEEIIELDPKDKEIQMLRNEIEKMKGMMSNAVEYDNTDIDEPVKKQVTKTVSTNKRSNAK